MISGPGGPVGRTAESTCTAPPSQLTAQSAIRQSPKKYPSCRPFGCQVGACASVTTEWGAPPSIGSATADASTRADVQYKLPPASIGVVSSPAVDATLLRTPVVRSTS